MSNKNEKEAYPSKIKRPSIPETRSQFDVWQEEFAELLGVTYPSAKLIRQAVRDKYREQTGHMIRNQRVFELNDMIRESGRKDWTVDELVNALLLPRHNEQDFGQLAVGKGEQEYIAVTPIRENAQKPPKKSVDSPTVKGKQELIQNPLIQDVADLLAVSISNAESILAEIRTQVQRPIMDDEVLDAILLLDGESWTTGEIVQLVKIGQIINVLQISVEETRRLPLIIEDRFQLSITYDDILRFIDDSERPITEQDVRNYFYAQWKFAYHIAKILNISEDEAFRYEQRIHERISWSVTHTNLLVVIGSLPVANRNLETVVDELERIHIAQYLSMPIGAVDKWIKGVCDTDNNVITRSEVIEVFPYFDADEMLSYPSQFIALRQISNVLERPLADAVLLVHDIQTKADNSVSYQEVLDVCKDASADEMAVDSIIQRLEERNLARQLNLTVQQLEEWPQTLTAIIGMPIRREQIMHVIQNVDESAVAEDIERYFWQKYYPIPQIGVLLDIPAFLALQEISKIHKKVPYSIQDEDILEALEALPADQHGIGDIVGQLDKQRLASRLEISMVDVNGLIIEINQARDTDLSVTQILSIFSLLNPPNDTSSDLMGLLHTSGRWGKSHEQVLQMALLATNSVPDQIPLVELWPIMQQIQPELQNEDDLGTYFYIRYLLKKDNPSFVMLNRLVKDIKKLKNKKRFWGYIKNSNGGESLTIKDFNYFLTLMTWSANSVYALSPKNRNKEQWISHQYIKEIMGGHYRIGKTRRKELVPKLSAYAKKCWREMSPSKRVYGIPSNGRAEIVVSNKMKSLIHLSSVRFRQEGIPAPGLFIQFKFDNPAIIGLVQVRKNGSIDGFHKMSSDLWFRSMIEAIAISHVRDLVIPNDISFTGRNRRTFSRVRDTSSRSQRSKSPQAIKQFPRRTPQKNYDLSEWYEAQRAYHSVRGHRRTESPTFSASLKKRREAMKAGVKLKKYGETWVSNHMRGNPQNLPIDLDGADLVRHTIFRESPRSSSELARILG